jgi:hypothetical protein
MFNILSLIPGKHKKTQGGWTSFNSVCCQHRGHKPDKKGRGGIIFSNSGNQWNYNCFNCHFKCVFVLGKSISGNTRKLLQWCGVDDAQIDKWSFDSLRQRDLIEIVVAKKKKLKQRILPSSSLPVGSESINYSNPAHKQFSEYLLGRGFKEDQLNNFYITPREKGRNRDRIIIPCKEKNRIVGHISRYLDSSDPKYIVNIPDGYMFGYDNQLPRWQVCIVVEGVFDALSIDGCALGHNKFSPIQIDLLKNLERPIIFVPDYDKAGLGMTDEALELGFSVSLPKWKSGTKDVNDAVKKYGKLPTLLSIIQSATNSKIKIEMAKRRILNGNH